MPRTWMLIKGQISNNLDNGVLKFKTHSVLVLISKKESLSMMKSVVR